MRILFILPVINLLVVSNSPLVEFSSVIKIDTTTITHLLDGNIGEWPTEKFTTDKTTKIRYAVDNNGQLLFLVISIPDKSLQQSVMRQGMSLFIDAKGKRKENRGVEFPLVMTNGQTIDHMKIFGFSSVEPFSQNIKTDGTINIAILFDSANILSIEYNIPMKMLEGPMDELNNKKISVGWKINTDETQRNITNEPVKTSSRLVAVPAGTRPPVDRNVGANKTDPFPQSGSTKAQSIWTTHTITF